MSGAIVVSGGITPEALHVLLRATARTSLALFLAVFVAAPLQQIRPSGVARWLVANRRYLGVSFATSHTFHLAAIIALTRASEDGPHLVTLVLGGLGYLFILAMAATSFDVTAAWLGARRWKRLHTTGVYYLWLVFALTSLGGVDKDPLAAVALALLVAAMALRLGRRLALRPRTAPAV